MTLLRSLTLLDLQAAYEIQNSCKYYVHKPTYHIGHVRGDYIPSKLCGCG